MQSGAFLPRGALIEPPTPKRELSNLGSLTRRRLIAPLIPKAYATLGLNDVAEALGVPRSVVEALMERERWASVQKGRDGTSRFLMTPEGIAQGIGRNLRQPMGRRYFFITVASIGLERLRLALGWSRVLNDVNAVTDKKQRAAFVRASLRWLPLIEQAKLAGYSKSGWLKLVGI